MAVDAGSRDRMIDGRRARAPRRGSRARRGRDSSVSLSGLVVACDSNRFDESQSSEVEQLPIEVEDHRGSARGTGSDLPEPGATGGTKGNPGENDGEGVGEGTGERLARLEALVEEFGALALLGWKDLSPEGATRVVQVLERSARAAAAIRSDAITAMSKQEGDRKHGSRNLSEQVATNTGRSKAAAYRAVKAAEDLDKYLPETKKALARGEISEEHVDATVRWATRTQKHRERLKDPEKGETYLLEKAKQMGATPYSNVAKAWGTETDPEAADREYLQSAKKQSVNLTPVADGFLLKGVLDHSSGQILQTALAARMGRKAADDERSFPERRAEALVGLARESLDEGKHRSGARIRPHLTITMDYLTLERLVDAHGPSMPESTLFAHGLHNADEATRAAAQREWAEQWQPGDDHVISTELDYRVLEGVPAATLPDGSPLAPTDLARLACESMLARVVFGPESTILDAGREKRIFPAHHVRAIIARDRTCQYPGCDEGPEFSEVHHSLEWYKHGGTTHADLGILLCYAHHSHVHRRGITITRTSGRWQFFDAEDTLIVAPTEGIVPRNPVTPRPEQGEESDLFGGQWSAHTQGDSSAMAGAGPNRTRPPGRTDPPREVGPPGRASKPGPASAPGSAGGAPRVVIRAEAPLCPEAGEQETLNLDPEPPF